MSSMTSARSGYTALPQDDVTTTMAPRASPPPQSATSGCSTSGTWRRSDVGQLPVSFCSDVELDELTSESTATTLTTTAISPPPQPVARDHGCCPGPADPSTVPAGPSAPSSPIFQVGNSACTASATSHVKRRVG